MALVPSLQNFQVIIQNVHSEGVHKEICKKRKKNKRMRLHELSRLPERDNQSMFSTKEKNGQKESNQNNKKRKECHEHYTIFMIQNLFHFKMKVACICIPKSCSNQKQTSNQGKHNIGIQNPPI